MTIIKAEARCHGVGSDAEGWREGCETCLRRTTDAECTCKASDMPFGQCCKAVFIKPPAIIAFECEYLLEPQE